MATPIEIELKVAKVFKDNDLHYEYGVNPKGEVNVEVHWGDWKHDHLHLAYVMEHNGFTKVGEMPFGEPTGDDTYSATHVYKLNESNRG